MICDEEVNLGVGIHRPKFLSLLGSSAGGNLAAPKFCLPVAVYPLGRDLKTPFIYTLCCLASFSETLNPPKGGHSWPHSRLLGWSDSCPSSYPGLAHMGRGLGSNSTAHYDYCMY
ncbi:hypothetical protein AAHA92_15783 [Salvia divinorum]|uniref:Uncharacterized protein n=1 Tax=Salvia divinorum TaxID=28513 RepID=A0ABD1HGG3_SALDI